MAKVAQSLGGLNSARARLLAGLASHVRGGTQLKPRYRLVKPGTATSKPVFRRVPQDRSDIEAAAKGALGRLAGIRRGEQDKLRAQVIAGLTGKVGRLKKAIGKIGGLFGSIFGKAREIKDKLTGRQPTPTPGHARLGSTPTVAARRGPVQSFGFVSVTPIQKNPMRSVSSSNVSSIGWEPDDQNTHVGILYILFRNNWLYAYHHAPSWLYEGLSNAGSKGRYVWAYIRRGLFPDGVPYGSADVEGYERIDSAGRPYGYTGKIKQIAALRGRRRGQ